MLLVCGMWRGIGGIGDIDGGIGIVVIVTVI